MNRSDPYAKKSVPVKGGDTTDLEGFGYQLAATLGPSRVLAQCSQHSSMARVLGKAVLEHGGLLFIAQDSEAVKLTALGCEQAGDACVGAAANGHFGFIYLEEGPEEIFPLALKLLAEGGIILCKAIASPAEARRLRAFGRTGKLQVAIISLRDTDVWVVQKGTPGQ